MTNQEQTNSNQKWQTFSEKQKQEQPEGNGGTSSSPAADETAEMPEKPASPNASTVRKEAEHAEWAAQIESYRDKAARAQAELDNLRRRSEREIANARKFSNERLLGDLLPVVDSLTRALSGEVPQETRAKAIYDGLQLTQSMLDKVLSTYGIVTIQPEPGTPFDPQRHEAMSMQNQPEFAAQAIIQVLQKGYELNGRVIRAAMVVVNQ